MPTTQSYTASANLVLQSVDNVTGLTISLLNEVLSNAVGIASRFETFVGSTLPTVLSIGNIMGLYVKNLSSSIDLISLSWDFTGTGAINIIQLYPGQCIFVFAQTGHTFIQNVTYTPNTTADVETVVWR